MFEQHSYRSPDGFISGIVDSFLNQLIDAVHVRFCEAYRYTFPFIIHKITEMY